MGVGRTGHLPLPCGGPRCSGPRLTTGDAGLIIGPLRRIERARRTRTCARKTRQTSGGHVDKQNMMQRRAIIAGLGAVAAAGALGAGSAEAQGPSSDSFTPMLHPQDEWMSAMKGKHRIVLDVTSPTGVPDAIRFAGNLLTGHKNGWGVEESDVAVLACFRHGATPYGYTDAIWAKYGKTIDPKATPPPTVEPLQLWRTGADRGARQARRAVHGVRDGQPRAGGPYRGTRRRRGRHPRRNGRQPDSQRAYRAGRCRRRRACTGAPVRAGVGRMSAMQRWTCIGIRVSGLLSRARH